MGRRCRDTHLARSRIRDVRSGIDARAGDQLTDRARRPDQILGADVVLTGCHPGRERDLVRALEEIGNGVSYDAQALPIVVLSRISTDRGDQVRGLLEAAGGKVTLRDAWVTRDRVPDPRPRPACPSCGSLRTQPFTHAGPVARVNMKCTNCGHLFRSGRFGT